MRQDDPYEKGLRDRIRNSEERFISYKKLLEGVHRDKDAFPPDEQRVIEHKEMLRDAKNNEESHLKHLVEEKTYYPGITPTQSKWWMEKHARESSMRNAALIIEKAIPLMDQQQKEAAEKLPALLNG